VKRSAVAALAVAVVLASAGAGAGAWLLARPGGARQPQISAYSNGHLTRVQPYLFCKVLDLTDCQMTQTQGQLPVDPRDPVQLSVDGVISRAPWRLLQVYPDPANTTTTVFRPNTAMAVTVPTIDAQRGPLSGLVVQLLTLVVDPAGRLYDVPHAEWSVRLLWN
jgi:hypothetical protein